MLHKGEHELVLFQDSRLIIMYGNFFSSTRCGLIGRGSHWSPTSHQVYAPEALHHYGRDGRSATDGDDQQQKKLAMAERRCQRAGTKGILWGLDRAFTNGHIVEKLLAPESTLPFKMVNHYSKVRRCLACFPPVCPDCALRARRSRLASAGPTVCSRAPSRCAGAGRPGCASCTPA